jgi:hypothetical protein
MANIASYIYLVGAADLGPPAGKFRYICGPFTAIMNDSLYSVLLAVLNLYSSTMVTVCFA